MSSSLLQKHRYLSKCSAVVSNGKQCAAIGIKMLADGGSAVDAAIATLLCEGVVLPYCMGIGGGFVATVYSKAKRKVETLIAREAAPAAAHKNMFVGKSSVTGALSCAVPGEILGYWELHKRYGRLPWKHLFHSAIKLAKEGHEISQYVANALKVHETTIRNEPTLACLYLKDHKLLEAGELVYYEALATTLETIAEQGAACFYGPGNIGSKFVQDVQELGGIITKKDLQTYTVRWGTPVVSNFGNYYTMYSTPCPTSGILIALILNVLNGLYTPDRNLYWHRVVETLKHAFGCRTLLGDYQMDPEMGSQIKRFVDLIQTAKYVQHIRRLIQDEFTFDNCAHYGAHYAIFDDSGTANVAALEASGDAITITSTINTKFAAKKRSCQTGILLNDEMDDFATPGIVNNFGLAPSPANFIHPGKVPFSSMCPCIILDKHGNVSLLVGGAGGTNIVSAVAMTIIRYCILNQPIETAVNDSRFHHQLLPNYLEIEQDFPYDTIEFLASIGHKCKIKKKDKYGSAVTAIGVQNLKPTPVYDKRRVGSTSCIKNETDTKMK